MEANQYIFSLSIYYKALLGYIAYFTFFPALLTVFLHRLRGVKFAAWRTNYIAFQVCLDTNFPELITIEEGAWLTRGVTILTHFNAPNETRKLIGGMVKGPVQIGRHAFIGVNAIVLPNIRVGHHAIVGAGSVVTKDVPDFAVVGGNPARIIRYLDSNLAVKR